MLGKLHYKACHSYLLNLGSWALGPILWGPLSEVYGRKLAVLIPFFLGGVFSFATGASQDIQAILICRFFTGVFGSAPITNSAGVLSDLCSPEVRGTAVAVYAVAVNVGPFLGPVIGSAVIESFLGWRWTQYVSKIQQTSLTRSR